MGSTTDILAPAPPRHDLSAAERSFAVVREDLAAVVQQFLIRFGEGLGLGEAALDETASVVTQMLLVLMRSHGREPHWSRSLQVLTEQVRDGRLTRETAELAANQWLEYLPEHFGPDAWTDEDRQVWADLMTQVLQSVEAGGGFSRSSAESGGMDQPILKTPSDDCARSVSTIVPFPQPVDGSCPTIGQDPSPLLESQTMSLQTSVSSETSAGPAHAAVENFYGLIEQAPLAALHVDPQNTVTFINAAGQELLHELSDTFGFGPDELVGNSIQRLQQVVPGLRKAAAGVPFTVTVGARELEIQHRPLTSSERRPVGTAYFFRDVTEVAAEKRHARELQAEMNGKLDAVDRTNAVIEFQLDGTIVNANKNFLDVLGYTLDEIRGRHHSMFVDEAYRTSAEYREFWAKLNRGENISGELKRIAKGGREVWIQAIYSPIRNTEGKVVKVVKFATDITTEVQSRATIADAAGKMDAVNRTNAVIEFQLDGTILTANTNFLNAVGYTLEEIRGRHHSMFVEEAYRTSAEYREFWAKLNRGENVSGEMKRIAKGGREIWIRAIYAPIKDQRGNLAKVVKFATEVTAEIQARDQAVRTQNMMDNLPINVVMAGRDTKIVYMNPATVRTLKTIEHLLPVPVDQLKGQSFDILHRMPEMQRRIVGDPKNLPHRARIKLGPETLDLLVSAIMDSKGEYLGPMVTWSVITGQVKMADDFERDVKGVVQIVTSSATEMQASSKSLAAASEETARQSQVVAAASEEATRNVETVSSAAEELSKSIAEISRHVQDASKMTSMAVTEADKTNITIKQLGDSSNEIGQVVKVITSIAQQTNLLALNATIEAARAGEAGKGFAVVANEVKELARQTAKATEEISQKINAIQSATGIAVTAIGSISDSIRKINEISTTIASAVEEQTAATTEISRNVSEAARGTAEVSSNIAGVSQAAEEGGRGASDILVASEGLAQESVRLDGVTSSFLERLRKM
ncbi:MAG: PAS domain-containing methyl-accepting chemotaxis protein [Planctomycetaceae bacterium]|nr:PAS domain-containing methyl-accepting chemotaxis protein [Planctomycetaceae bacterium]